MKKLIIASIITVLATSAFASKSVFEETVKESVAETVAIILVDFTEALSIATSKDYPNTRRKSEALRIQNDVQQYSQSGITSVFLDEKIRMVKAINGDLSLEESIDVLILASNEILKL